MTNVLSELQNIDWPVQDLFQAIDVSHIFDLYQAHPREVSSKQTLNCVPREFQSEGVILCTYLNWLEGPARGFSIYRPINIPENLLQSFFRPSH